MPLSEDTFQIRFLTKPSCYTSPEIIFVEPSMTAASIFGNEKGPCSPCEKSEDLSSKSYTQKYSYLSYMVWLILNQGSQSSGMTLLCSHQPEGWKGLGRVVALLKWMLFSPHLDSIEAVRNWMKNYIQFHYPDFNERKQWIKDELCFTVIEAWKKCRQIIL
ncbi:hypothetical protein K3495_g8570 [Podosphaera aphanis]|nr:hypothetical protein K3495_g8570 [Podosphaera aphanis]